MEDQTFAVRLNVYDLSALFDTSGQMRNMIGQFIPGFEGIWHTGIVVYGKEFYYGGGVINDHPGATPYGTPTTSVELGTTQIPEEVFSGFLEEMRQKYTLENYDIFDHNCNHFCEEASVFLTGNSIPSYILNLPQQFAQSPMGQMLMPMIRQFTRGGQLDPASMNAQAGLGAGLPHLNNMFGGGGMPGNGMFNMPSAPTQPTPPQQTQAPVAPTQRNHGSLPFRVLPVRTKQATLYSSSSSVAKIFLKLSQLIQAQDAAFLTEERKAILLDLQKCLDKRKAEPNYSIPAGSFRLLENIYELLPAAKVFPVMDVLRLLVLHPTAAEYFGNSRIEFVDRITNELILPEKPPSEPGQWLGARVLSNLCGMEGAGPQMISDPRIDSLMDVIMLGFRSSVKQFRHTAATIAFNASLRCQSNSDVTLQMLSAVIHALNEPGSLPEDVVLTLLMTLGRLLYQNQDSMDTAQVLELNLAAYKQHGNDQIKQAAQEIESLFNTPA